MINQYLLSFSGIDVNTTGYDHVAESIRDEDVTYFIHVGDFTQGKDTGRNVSGCRLFRIIVVDHAATCSIFEK